MTLALVEPVVKRGNVRCIKVVGNLMPSSGHVKDLVELVLQIFVASQLRDAQLDSL